jgi:hypothetical protein
LNNQDREAFKAALNNACGEINEAARLSTKIFQGNDLNLVRRDLARLLEIIDSKLLERLDAPSSPES